MRIPGRRRRNKMAAPETKQPPPLARRAYTEPLGLMAQLKRPPIKLDVVPVLDLLVIALLFSLLFTRFVMVPGVRVDLPDAEMRMQPSNLPVAVLTIGNRGMLFFDGAVFELNSIDRGFRRHIEGQSAQEVVLLVKTEGSMDLQLFLKLCQMAQEAGFAQVQIAGERGLDPSLLLPDGEGAESGFFSVM